MHGSPSIALRVCVGRPSIVAAVKTRFDGNGGGRERARERTAERRVAKQVRSRGELSPASITKNRLEWNGSCSQRTRKTEASDFSASVCFKFIKIDFLKPENSAITEFFRITRFKGFRKCQKYVQLKLKSF